MADPATVSVAAGPTAKVSDVVRSYRPVKKFQSKGAITSVDFDDAGDYLAAAGEDETIQIFDIKTGKSAKAVPSKKYGVHLAKFTHHSRQLLHASTKLDDSLRLLDLHNESYLRYFSAHTDKVTSIALAPGNDSFLSCSMDNHVMLWDINSRNAQGKLKLAKPHLAAFDPSGSVFAVASHPLCSILLYDYRNYDKHPFATFEPYPYEKARNRAPPPWTKIEFSNDGKYLLLLTDGPGHYVLDAFNGSIKGYLVGKTGSPGRSLTPSTSSTSGNGKELTLGQEDAMFTPDGQYVIGGSGEHSDLLVWDLNQLSESNITIRPSGKLPCNEGRSSLVQMNPRYNMIATADRDILFWLPGETPKTT